MIVRDGRGVVHDLGPRRTLSVSGMKIAAGYGEEATGGWTSASHDIFSKRVNVTPEARQARKTAATKAARDSDVIRHREMERVRAARSRARRRLVA